MSGAFECDNALDNLQAKYDRKIDQKRRALKYYDEAPDGSIQKQMALDTLAHLNTQMVEIEKEFDRLLS